MPINTGLPMPEEEKTSIWWPDYVPTGKESHAVTHSMGYNEALPPDLDKLPKEVQERLKARYRFLGIKLRHDLDVTIPLSRETLDLP